MSSPALRGLAARFALASLLLAACSDGGDATTRSTSTTGSTSTTTSGGGGGGGGGAGGGAEAACPESGVSKGPWALYVTETTATVRWEACATGTDGGLTLTPEGGGAAIEATSVETPFEVTTTHTAPLNPDAPPDLPGTYYMHEALVEGLAPATCYTYALGASASLAGRLCTARAPGDALRFMALGDTNPGLGNATENILAHALPLGPDFTVHAGDIQYYDSFLETWTYWFGKMEPMLAQGAFYPVIGNHESERPGEFEEYFGRFFAGAGEGTAHYYRHSSAGVTFFAIDTEQPFGPSSPQGGWLAGELAAAKETAGYRFSVIVMHRPFATCGDSDHHEPERLEWTPTFQEYGVKLVLQGHMHGYERFEMDGITFITTGGGGGAIGDVDENIDRAECASRVASGGIKHALIVDVDASGFTGQAVDEEGAVRDTFTMLP